MDINSAHARAQATTAHTATTAKGGGTGSAASGLVDSFMGFLQKSGQTLSTTGLSGTGQEIISARKTDENRPAVSQKEDYGRNHDDAYARDRADGNDHKRVDDRPADRNEDYRADNGGRDTQSDTGTRQDDRPADRQDASHDQKADNSASDHSNGDQADKGQSDTGTSKQESASSEQGQNGQADAQQSANANGAEQAGAHANVAAQTNAAQQSALNAALAGQANTAQTGEKTATAENTQQISGVDAKMVGNGDVLKSATAGQQNQAQTQNQGQNPAHAQNQSQAQNATQTQNANQPGLAEQAADLSDKVGKGQKVKVGVEVKDESAQVTSQLRSTLTTGSVNATEGGSKSTNGQGQNQANANGTQQGQAQANAQAAQQLAGQAQAMQGQQNAQQTAQLQTQAGGDVKAVGQAASQQASSAQTATQAGGESSATNAANTSNQTQQAQQTQTAKAAHTPQQTFKQMAVAEQVSVQITKGIQAGLDRISVKLNPQELGRVEVQLEMAKDGKMTATIVADRPETLDALKNDAKALEKALQDAGLNADAGNMEFSLRGEQNHGKGEDAKSANGGATDGEEAVTAEAGATEDPVILPDYSLLSTHGLGGINIRV